LATLVTIPPGAVEARVDLEVHCGLYIEGTVLGPDGRPAADAVVSAAVTEMDASTDALGVFRLGPLAPGEYGLRAWKSSFPRSAPVSARAGTAGVELQLELGGNLRVAVVDGA